MLSYGYLLIVYALLALFVTAVFLLRSRMAYWRMLGIPHDRPAFLYGNLKSFAIARNLADAVRITYNKFKSNDSTFCGFFLFCEPIAIVTDLELTRSVLVRDFKNFDDRGLFHNKRDDELSENLLSMEPTEWRTLGRKLLPLFTLAKMQQIFPNILKVGKQLTHTFGELQSVDAEQEMHALLQCYTSDVLGNCVFGLECNSLETPEEEFHTMTKRMTTKPRHSAFSIALMQCLPKFAQRWCMRKSLDEAHNFVARIVDDKIAEHEKNTTKRNDLISMLIELKHAELEENRLSDAEITANAALFFNAGYASSAATMTFTLYELALNQQVQAKLSEEITQALTKHDGELSYKALIEMKYLDMVIAETLRKYPIYPYLERVANVDYETTTPGFTIYSGMKVLIPVEAIQHDSEFYDEPAKFMPERFNFKEMRRRNAIAWLPFGDGPRNCTGMRFAQLLIRIGLVSLLSKYKFKTCARTPTPMTYEETSLLLMPKNNMYLRAESFS